MEEDETMTIGPFNSSITYVRLREKRNMCANNNNCGDWWRCYNCRRFSRKELEVR